MEFYEVVTARGGHIPGPHSADNVLLDKNINIQNGGSSLAHSSISLDWAFKKGIFKSSSHLTSNNNISCPPISRFNCSIAFYDKNSSSWRTYAFKSYLCLVPGLSFIPTIKSNNITTAKKAKTKP